jgi:hypothetical protein
VGETAAETAAEIAGLRTETSRLLDALQQRGQAFIAARRQAVPQPVALGALALTSGAVVLALWYRSYRRAAARRRTAALRRAGASLPPAPRGRETAGAGTGLAEKLVGAVAASATLALVDQFTRWLSARRQQTVRREPVP